jgi:hypothetical protein
MGRSSLTVWDSYHAGIIIAIVWSLVLGIIVALIGLGLIAFGGFARGKWY